MSTLLLVDTDPLSLRVLAVSLRREGFTVMTARDGEEAIEELGAAVPDLVVSDARLRESDGLALVKAVREREGGADVPFILLSGDDAPAARELAAAFGIDEVIVRPVFVRELVARVNLLLSRRAANAILAGPSDVGHRSGTTEELALVDLLQSLETTGATGVVHLLADGQEARVYLRDGNVVDAELGRLRGADVVHRALAWEHASFRVELGPVDNDDLLECTTEALLMRAMDRLEGRTPTPLPVAAPALAEPTPRETPVGERSVPSTAPWTREAELTSHADGDLVAAGVPHPRRRALRRAGVVLVAAAALGVVAMSLGSVRARQAREAAAVLASRPVVGAPLAAEAPVVPAAADPIAPGIAAAPAVPADSEASGVAPESAAPAAGTDPAAAAAIALGAPSAGLPSPVVDPRERLLDVRNDVHAKSPLVRAAERALLKGDTAAALNLAQQAVAANSGDADGWLTLAAARKAAGDLTGAKDAYGKCVKSAHTFGVMSCRALANRSE